MILHSLKALKKSASEEGEIKPNSVEVGFVGRDSSFKLLKEDQIKEYLKKAEGWKGSGTKMEAE